MKILIVNTLYTPNIVGGAERSVQFLAESLVQKKIETVIVCTKPESGTHTTDVNGVKVYYVGLKNFYWPFHVKDNSGFLKSLWHGVDSYNFMMASELGRILEQECPDVVHTNNLAGFSVAVWREVKVRNIPLIHTLRDYYLLCPSTTMFKQGHNCETQCLSCSLYSYPRKQATNKVDIVVGISQYILSRHLKHGYFSKSKEQRVIFNAFDTRHIPTSPNENGKSVQFGYLGRLHQNKGIELILKALAGYPSHKWALWIAGNGDNDYVQRLKDCYGLQNVHFMGFTNPEELFAKIDVLLTPSLWGEPLGRIVIEAYAHSVPVIGSNRGGIPEIIDNGETGFLFNPDDLSSLEATIRLFIEEPCLVERMRPAILEKAKDFLPERIVNQYLTVYEKVLS